MKVLLLIIFILSFPVKKQRIPAIVLNHFYLVIDSTDLSALINSHFIKEKFAACKTNIVKADNNESWTGTYLYAVDNYFEIFDSTGVGEKTGNAGLGLGIETIGGLKRLNQFIKSNYHTEISTRTKKIEGEQVPWFDALSVEDPVFVSSSPVSFWIMEYRNEYFIRNHLPHKNNELTRLDYLDKFKKERSDKILKRFSGITLNVNNDVKSYLYKLLLDCGFTRSKDQSLTSADNFTIEFTNFPEGKLYSISRIAFECNKSIDTTVPISPHISIIAHGRAGNIIFK